MKNNRKLYNSKIINTHIMLIGKRYPDVNIGDLLDYAGIKKIEVKDDSSWFTQKQVNLFNQKARELTENTDFSREAGKFAASPEASNIMQRFLFASFGPAMAFRKIGKFTPRFTKSALYKSKNLADNKVEITVTPYDGVKEERFQCENRLGYFEAICEIFTKKFPKIEHPECMFKGGEVCRYIIFLEETRSDFFNKMRNYATLFLVISSFIISFILPWNTFLIVFLFSIFFILSLGWYTENLKTQELYDLSKNISDSYDELLQQKDINDKIAFMISEIGQTLTKETDVDDILPRIADILEGGLDYDQGMILLTNSNRTRLIYRGGFGYTDNDLKRLKKAEFQLNESSSKNLFIASLKGKNAILIKENEIKDNPLFNSLKLLKRMNPSSLICCPIIFEEEPLGILEVQNINTKRPLLQSDINLLRGIAPQIGAIINQYLLSIKSTIERIKKKDKLVEDTQKDFAMRAVHNIRNPASAIHTNLIVLKRDFEFEPEVRKIIDSTESQIVRIEKLAADFMRYVKPIEMRVARVDLVSLIESVIHRYNESANKTKVVFNSDKEALQIDVDMTGITWVIEEMLNNAIKHNARMIKIKASLSDDKVDISFEDDGSGVKEKVKDKLFIPFSSDDPMSTGLGLTNVKKIVEEHKGRAYYDSSYTDGARFVIELPVNFS